MDTNTMYIEHYIDLHNYINDNIYELNDDVIFTESIWKKVLIGGLAIGSIALIWKYHKQIMEFIQKLLRNKTKKAVNSLQALGNQIVEESEEDVKNLKKEKSKDDEEEDEANRRLKSINKFNINKFKQNLDKNYNKLYIFKTIYKKIENNKLNENENFMIYYLHKTDIKYIADLIEDGVFNDLNKIKNKTTKKSIHDISLLSDEFDIFKILFNYTNKIEKTINKNQYKSNNIDLLNIIDNLQNLLLDAYVYIVQVNKDMDYFYKDDKFSDDAKYYRFDTVKDMINFGYKYNDYCMKNFMKLIMNKEYKDVYYIDENGEKQVETIYRFNDENLEHLLKEINNFKSSGQTEVKISEESLSRGAKYKFENVLTIIKYHKWFLKQLVDLSDTVNNLLS